MMTTSDRRIHALLTITLLSAAAAAGCWTAAGAAAGAAGAIAYTERGARSQVDASVGEAVAATEAVFRDRGIRTTEREVDDGDEIELEGQIGDRDIDVDIEREDPGVTEIEVTVQESIVEYDRDEARAILQDIVARL